MNTSLIKKMNKNDLAQAGRQAIRDGKLPEWGETLCKDCEAGDKYAIKYLKSILADLNPNDPTREKRIFQAQQRAERNAEINACEKFG